jgi:ferredoxin-NADP reductase
LQAAFAGNVGVSIGFLIIAALAAQMLLILFTSVRRVFYEREQQNLSRQRLQLLVKAAALKAKEAEQVKLLWNGCRKFRVARKVFECHDVYSFYLAPHDGKPLPAFKPGQYVTFQLDIPGRDKPVIRCYSLSDSHRPDYYRVTIKRACAPAEKPDAPHGCASSYFCDYVKEGDILDVKAPGGNFCIDLATNASPVVLISGGVGITPMLSMAHAILESGDKRDVWFFFGARNQADHIQKETLQRLAAEHENFHLHICYSKPAAEDKEGQDYQHAERVSVELMKKVLPSNNFQYYICGPGAFMKSVTDGLAEWGVPDPAVFFEAFGPATVKKAIAAAPTAEVSTATALQITFSRSGKTATWKPTMSSLLDLADEQGIKIESGCRAGNCGTCLVAIKSGAVDYLTEHGADAESGSCLTCICKPRTHQVLDA